MECLAKAYHHHLPQQLSLHHLRPSNPQIPIAFFSFTTPSSTLIRTSSSSDPHHQNPKPQFTQTLNPTNTTFIIPSVAIAASALLFMRLHRLHQNPLIITAPIKQEQESATALKELPLEQKPNHIQALHFYKLHQGTIIQLIDVNESNDSELLKARIRRSSEWLESARRELKGLIEKDPVRVTGYSQVVDELIDILRSMEVHIEQCEKENDKGYLIYCNHLLARVRKLECQILDALRHIQENREEED